MNNKDTWKIARAIFDGEWMDYKIEFNETDAYIDSIWEKDQDHYFDLAEEYGRALKTLGYTVIL